MLSYPAGLRELHADIKQRLTIEQIHDANRLRNALPDWEEARSYLDLGKMFPRLSKAIQQRYSEATFLEINRFMIVDLALTLEKILLRQHTPDHFIPLYNDALSRLHHFLTTEPDMTYFYPHEYFMKDLRFCAGLMVPCGAMVTDLRNIVGWKLGPPILLQNSLHNIIQFTYHHLREPWFRSHVESRYIEDFNEVGMQVFFARVCLLLKQHQFVKGLAISSWFYDSKLEHISPHLRYLWQYPTQHGGIIIRGKASAFDIASALKTSKNRKILYDKGEYHPTSCLLLWPRESMLNWYREHGTTML